MRVRQKAVRFHLIDNNGQLRRAKSPACKNPHHSYLMACTVFLQASAQSTLLLFFSVTLFAKGKKDVCTPTTTTVLHLRQKKKQLKAIIHNM